MLAAILVRKSVWASCGMAVVGFLCYGVFSMGFLWFSVISLKELKESTNKSF